VIKQIIHILKKFSISLIIALAIASHQTYLELITKVEEKDEQEQLDSTKDWRSAYRSLFASDHPKIIVINKQHL